MTITAHPFQADPRAIQLAGQAAVPNRGGDAGPVTNTRPRVPPSQAVVDQNKQPLAFTNTTAQADIQSILDPFGLGNLGSWAWNTYVSAGGQQLGIDAVNAALPQQQEFKTRFPAIATRVAQGLPAISPADYINYEQAIRGALVQYGLPLPTTGSQFNDMITGLLNNDVSAAEVVNQRIPSAFARVKNAPVEVQQAAEGIFGANSMGTLAAAFLNPKLDTNTIEQMSKTAEVQGTAQRFGIDINADTAKRLEQVGADSNLGNFQTLAMQKSLFDQQPGEANNLQIGVQGVNAAFGADATSQLAVEKQLMARKALTSGGAGTPYTQSSLSATPGVSGLGQGPV